MYTHVTREKNANQLTHFFHNILQYCTNSTTTQPSLFVPPRPPALQGSRRLNLTENGLYIYATVEEALQP